MIQSWEVIQTIGDNIGNITAIGGILHVTYKWFEKKKKNKVIGNNNNQNTNTQKKVVDVVAEKKKKKKIIKRRRIHNKMKSSMDMMKINNMKKL